MTDGSFEHVGCPAGGRWKPAHGWVGRYRCDGCAAFGLKEKLVSAGRDVFGDVRGFGRERIRAYKCQARVEKEGIKTTCGKAAVMKTERQRSWRCSEHRE